MESMRAVFSLVALRDPAEILPLSVPLDRRRRRFAIVEVKPFGTFDPFVSDLRKVEEDKKKNDTIKNNHDQGTSIISPDISRFEPTTQKWLKHIADTCLSLRINHAAVTDHVRLIMLVFPAMNISQDSSSAPGWLRAAARDTPFDV
ncbi:hypothetical protein COL516b_008784 [Colletotrichum fioriniae]|nr:uncharacterized protein COL516b_008784 [Colletotrichum fioriniae]KAJ0300042.1 hypothetical protein COL516b_008784 [Colletotrichum fioriniae]